MQERRRSGRRDPRADPGRRLRELNANFDQRRSGEPSRRVCRRWISRRLRTPPKGSACGSLRPFWLVFGVNVHEKVLGEFGVGEVSDVCAAEQGLWSGQERAGWRY